MKIRLKNIYLGHAQCDLKLVFDSLASVKFLTHDVLIGGNIIRKRMLILADLDIQSWHSILARLIIQSLETKISNSLLRPNIGNYYPVDTQDTKRMLDIYNQWLKM